LVKGTISGSLNNEKLSDVDFYSYVLTHPSDSRNLVAIGNIPYTLGGSFQVLISLASPINWLFAGRNGYSANAENLDEYSLPRLLNGFMTTGGAFTRDSVLNFYDEETRSTKELRIKQEFYGYDSINNEIYVDTEFNGQVPYIDINAQVVFKDFSQDFEQIRSGIISSEGELSYQITSSRNSQSFSTFKIIYSDEITFSQCPHDLDLSKSTIRVDSKRVQITYTKSDSVVKFTSANYMHSTSSSQHDPCLQNSCSIYAECVVDYNVASLNYSCLCKVGFEGDGQTCFDVNECENGDAICDENAICYNLVGHYECVCKSPYKGNGKQCDFDLDCRDCDSNAQCLENSRGQKTCVCNDGYNGDGYSCTLASSKRIV
jgi:nidogen (entactin)